MLTKHNRNNYENNCKGKEEFQNVSYNTLLFLLLSSTFSVRMDVEQKYRLEIRAFGQRLKELRRAENLTQLQLEILCGMDRSEISKIENGLKNIEFLTLIKLSNGLKLDLFELFISKEIALEVIENQKRPTLKTKVTRRQTRRARRKK